MGMGLASFPSIEAKEAALADADVLMVPSVASVAAPAGSGKDAALMG
jgi:hypothetical protein